MLSEREIYLGILLPLAVSLGLAAIAWWRNWRWLVPIGVGLAFLIGYGGSLGRMPGLPPADGVDWLFWTALPAVGLGVVAAVSQRHWTAVVGVWSAVTAWMILSPLVPAGVSTGAAVLVTLAAAGLGVAIPLLYSRLAEHLGHRSLVTALAITMAGAGVLVLASNLRTTGVYGLGAAGACAGAILWAEHLRSARALAVVAMPILIGVLVSGVLYPDPGAGFVSVSVLALCPVLMLIGRWIPSKRAWARGLAGLLAVAIATGAVVAPAAIAAKRAAEANPYGGY